MELKNRVFLITGAAGGIGSEISVMLAKEKAKLILVDRDEQKIKHLEHRLEKLGDIVYLVQDIRSTRSQDNIIDICIKRYNRIDCLINTAAISVSKYLTDIADSTISELIDTNLKALISITKRAIAWMEKQNSGMVINFSSLAGKKFSSRLLPYSAVKAGIIAFTEGIIKEAGDKGKNITAFAVCPGSTLTHMHYLTTAQQYGVMPEEVKKSLYSNSPIGAPIENLLMPGEVASQVIKLITGRIKIKEGCCLDIIK